MLRMVTEIYTLALFFVDSENFSYCLVVTYNIKERPNLDPTIVVDLLTIQLTHFFTPPSYHYYRLLLPQLTYYFYYVERSQKKFFDRLLATKGWIGSKLLDETWSWHHQIPSQQYRCVVVLLSLLSFLCSVFYFLAPHNAIKSEITKSAIFFFLEESLA